NGASANAKENSKSQTALMWAASEGHPAVVKLLIDRGADVNARSKIVAPAGRGGLGGGGGAGAGAGVRGGGRTRRRESRRCAGRTGRTTGWTDWAGWAGPWAGRGTGCTSSCGAGS